MRRRKRRKKMKNIKGLNNMSVIIMTTIAMLNIAGISYAYWNNGLDIKTSITTGKMELSDYDCEYKLVGNDKGEFFDVYIDDNDNARDNEDTITIDARVSSKYNDNLFIKIKNKGTIPVVLKEVDEKQGDNIIKRIEAHEGKILYPNDEEQVHIRIHVDNQNDEEQEHNFKYELKFDQWNK